MFDVMFAGILGCVASLVAVIASLITNKVEKRTRERQAQKIPEIEKKLELLHPIPTPFEEEQLNCYRERMIALQPIDNSRILPGSGKTHTLSVIAAIATTKTPIPTVLEQVGDTFS